MAKELNARAVLQVWTTRSKKRRLQKRKTPNKPSWVFNSKLQRRARHILRGDLHLDVGGADFLEAVGHDAVGEFGLVALAAQVREVKLAQLGGHDLRGGFGGGFVGQMAVAAENALLEAPRAARTILQHLHVMIGFEHEDVRGADAVE